MNNLNNSSQYSWTKQVNRGLGNSGKPWDCKPKHSSAGRDKDCPALLQFLSLSANSYWWLLRTSSRFAPSFTTVLFTCFSWSWS